MFNNKKVLELNWIKVINSFLSFKQSIVVLYEKNVNKIKRNE